MHTIPNYNCTRKIQSLPPELQNYRIDREWPGAGAFDHPFALHVGEFERLFGPGGGEFDRQISKSSNAQGGWGGLEDTN